MQFLNLRFQAPRDTRLSSIYDFLLLSLSFFFFFFYKIFYKIKRWNMLVARINAIRRARSRGSGKWPRYPWRITDVARQESNFSISSSTHRLEATRHPLLSIFIIRESRGEIVLFIRAFRFPFAISSSYELYLKNYYPRYVRNTFEWLNIGERVGKLSTISHVPVEKKKKRKEKERKEEKKSKKNAWELDSKLLLFLFQVWLVVCEYAQRYIVR